MDLVAFSSQGEHLHSTPIAHGRGSLFFLSRFHNDPSPSFREVGEWKMGKGPAARIP